MFTFAFNVFATSTAFLLWPRGTRQRNPRSRPATAPPKLTLAFGSPAPAFASGGRRVGRCVGAGLEVVDPLVNTAAEHA